MRYGCHAATLRPTGGRSQPLQIEKYKMKNEIATSRPERRDSQRRIATPLRCTTPPSAGLRARGKLARDDSLLRYVAGFFMRREYKETERGCRSPGAPPHPRHCVSPPLLKARGKGGQRSVYTLLRRTGQPSAKKKGTAEAQRLLPPSPSEGCLRTSPSAGSGQALAVLDLDNILTATMRIIPANCRIFRC